MRPEEPRFFNDDRRSVAADPGNNSGNETLIIIERQSKRREHRPVADFKLTKNVMEVHLDGAVGDIQPPCNFLVR